MATCTDDNRCEECTHCARTKPCECGCGLLGGSCDKAVEEQNVIKVMKINFVLAKYYDDACYRDKFIEITEMMIEKHNINLIDLYIVCESSVVNIKSVIEGRKDYKDVLKAIKPLHDKTHDIYTTIVRGIVCRTCNYELPPMFMYEHLEKDNIKNKCLCK